MKVVASLTTIPPRIEDECKRAIDSLIGQVDCIYLNVSKKYDRFGEMKVPDYLYEEPYKTNVVVNIGCDYGSSTKYLGSLESLTKEDQWVFVCDDDQEYHPILINRMKTSIKNKNEIYQNRFKTFQRYGTSGGLIHGYVGLLIHSTNLEGLKKFPLPEPARVVDDQWMSLYCAIHCIPIMCSGIDEYNEIFKTLRLDLYELVGKESLVNLGNRDKKIKELYVYFGLTL